MDILKTAYFAGLIDGEGNLGSYSSGANRRVRVEISVKMTCETTIKALQSHFGVGNIRLREPQNKNWKPQWAWRVSDKSAIFVIELILPFLITKKTSATELYEQRFIPKAKRGQ